MNKCYAPGALHAPDTTVDCRLAFAKRFDTLAKSQKQTVDPDLFILPDDSVCGSSDTMLLSQFPAPEVPPLRKTLIVPGLLGDTVAALFAPFFTARQALTVKGYCTQIAWVNGRRGCDHNAAILRRTILNEVDGAGAPVNLIAYSKGCADVMHMLSLYEDTHAAVAALVSYAGVVQGTPLAHKTSWFTRKFLQYAPLPGNGFGDDRAVPDLSIAFRKRWLLKHPLPSTIRYASVAAAPPRERVSRILQSSYDQLALSDPHNDSQVLWHDMVIPGSELLAIVRADHWALALPIDERLPFLSRVFVDQNNFPRRLMLRAIIDYLEVDVPTMSA